MCEITLKSGDSCQIGFLYIKQIGNTDNIEYVLKTNLEGNIEISIFKCEKTNRKFWIGECPHCKKTITVNNIQLEDSVVFSICNYCACNFSLIVDPDNQEIRLFKKNTQYFHSS